MDVVGIGFISLVLFSWWHKQTGFKIPLFLKSHKRLSLKYILLARTKTYIQYMYPVYWTDIWYLEQIKNIFDTKIILGLWNSVFVTRNQFMLVIGFSSCFVQFFAIYDDFLKLSSAFFGEIYVKRWSKLAKYENKTLFLKLAFNPIR